MNFKLKLKLKTTASNPAEALEIALKLLDDAKERVRVAMSDCRGGFALGAPMPLIGDRVAQLSLSYTDPEAINEKDGA